MTRTIIRLEEHGDDAGAIRVNFRPEEPRNVADRMRWRTLTCDPGKAPFSDLAAVAPGDRAPLNDDLVKGVGEALFTALRQHVGVEQALSLAAGAPPGELSPIHLLTSAMDAESLPWEALHHPLARFMGLDPRFQIARAVGTGGGVVERVHDGSVRIAAILAAGDRDACGEWAALRSAVNASGLDSRLTLFFANDALETEVLKAADSWVDLQRVPDTKEELVAKLEQLRPNLLHIYSHGSAQGSGFLEIATPASVAGFGSSPLYLEARHLAGLREHLWLVTLDACEGASPAEGVHSFAYTLVEIGVPAVVGMREVIDFTDANVFCRAFYTSALTGLAHALLPGTQVEVDWAQYLAPAREALCARIPGPAGATASKQKSWTLPVLYRRGEDLVVRTPRVDRGLDEDERERVMAELQVYRRVLAGLHPDSPVEVRQQLKAFVAEREARLRGE